MQNESHRSHAAVPTDAGVPATQPAQPTALNANGHDPNDFEWRPVPRRPRKDGWAPDVQQRFIEALARTGVVDHACREVNMSVSSAYALRHAPGGEAFARAWADTLTRAADRVLDVAMEQAIVGEEIPVFDQDGIRTGSKWKYNTRMAMFLLRAYHPERFRFAHRDTRHPDEPSPPPAAPMTEVVASLAPVPPADVHLTAPPGALADAVAQADHEEAKAKAGDDSWRPVPIAPAHPNVLERSRRNRKRRARAAEREEERHGLDPAETPPSPEEPADTASLEPGDPMTRWPPDYTDWIKQLAEKDAIPPALAARPPHASKRRRSRTSLHFASTSNPDNGG